MQTSRPTCVSVQFLVLPFFSTCFFKQEATDPLLGVSSLYRLCRSVRDRMKDSQERPQEKLGHVTVTFLRFPTNSLNFLDAVITSEFSAVFLFLC